MALGPIARVVAQVAVLGVSILARAIPAAYSQAVQNAKKGGVQAVISKNRISKSEALDVLNLSDSDATVQNVKKQYERYFAANEPKKGGSFYLQSKVVRAKELLDEYEKDKIEENKDEKKQQ